MRLATGAAVAAAVALAGCGGGAGDLLSIGATGGVAGGRHTVVVSGDGRGSCDRGPLKELPSGRVIDARAVERDAGDYARKASDYPPPPGAGASARRFTLRTKDGVVTWSERSRGIPSVLPKAQLLDVQLQSLLCR
jgi:hypothetical protein